MSNRDPLASLIEYVGTVKPYHTKVYEVILEYAHDEPVKASIKEKYEISVLMTTPEANRWFISEGEGWDTGPWDMDQNQPLLTINGKTAHWGRFDYADASKSTSPSRISTEVSERLEMEVGVSESESVHVYADVHSLGWDVAAWDENGFDAIPTSPRMTVEQQDDDRDPVGATITESLVIQVT